MLNALTVDVEDYFHATNLEPVSGPAKWHSLAPRIDWSLRRTLEIFARHNVKSTFFVLGFVARRFRSLIKEAAEQGHEIASHGYGHRLVYHQNPRSFYRDVRRTKYLLEDITGKPVYGYRAPNFSIRDNSLWAYDELIRAGYRYDSSLFPVKHPRYGNTHRSVQPELITRPGGKIIEMPGAVFVANVLGREIRLPVAGGAWWRLFPAPIFGALLSKIDGRRPIVCYFHPWEVDPGQPRFEQLSFLTKVRHYTGLSTFERKLDYFMTRIRFSPLIESARKLFPEAFVEDVTKTV